jgi:spore coat polysaccharide biosynthesis protein SpsF
MDITAVIQARMGSTRLPGKVLLPAADRPLLDWMAGQLAHCRRLKSVVLATTTAPADDAIAERGRALGWRVARGPEDDVLERFCLAGLEAGLTTHDGHVMRLTADCPLVQPDICDRLAEMYAAGDCDYARTSERFAEGLDCEVVSFAALLRARAEARLPSEREHVTLFVRNRPGEFRLCELESPEDCSRYRVTVDEPEDYAVVRALIKALGRPGRWISFARVREHLDAHPELMRLNAHIVRNEGLQRSLAVDVGGEAKG